MSSPSNFSSEDCTQDATESLGFCCLERMYGQLRCHLPRQLTSVERIYPPATFSSNLLNLQHP